MSSPAERADKVRDEFVTRMRPREPHRDAMAYAVLPEGSLVFHTRTEVIEWLRAGGLVVLDQQQAETVRKELERGGQALKCLHYKPDTDALALLSAGEGPKCHALRHIRTFPIHVEVKRFRSVHDR